MHTLSSQALTYQQAVVALAEQGPQAKGSHCSDGGKGLRCCLVGQVVRIATLQQVHSRHAVLDTRDTARLVRTAASQKASCTGCYSSKHPAPGAPQHAGTGEL